MPVIPSSPQASKRMRANRSRDTGPERAVRSLLHGAGYRFRVDHRPEPSLRTRADIVFTRRRVAVFIDGCFWHGCPEHGTWPKANAEFWREKIERNRRRDEQATARLRAAGWRVLRYWEHEEAREVAADIQRELESVRVSRRDSNLEWPDE